ncbi:hypothetical protein [Paracoccus rhizosphaerae]
MALVDLFLVGLLVLILNGWQDVSWLWGLAALIVWPVLVVYTFLRLTVRWSEVLNYRAVLLVGLTTVMIAA